MIYIIVQWSLECHKEIFSKRQSGFTIAEQFFAMDSNEIHLQGIWFFRILRSYFLESFYISSKNSRKWILAIFINNYFRLNIYCFTIKQISCWVFRPHTNWGDKLFCRAVCDTFARPLIFAMCRLTLLGTKQHQHTQLPWSSLATIGRGLKSSTPTTSSPIQATRVRRPIGHTKKLTRTKWGTWEDLCMLGSTTPRRWRKLPSAGKSPSRRYIFFKFQLCALV